MVTLIQEYGSKKDLVLSFKYLVVNSEEEARKLKFPGSPTFRIKELDIDPQARTLDQYGFS